MEAKYVQWRATYLRSSPAGLFCFYNGKGEHGDALTCSEAHGYAMLIAVLHRNRADFDGLFSFFLAFRNGNGLMKWQIRSPDPPTAVTQLYVDEDGSTSATDGDIDIASSLYLATRVFGEEDGRYRAEADALTSAILRYTIHPELGTPLLGDWANRDSSDGIKLYDATRTSDFILSAFALFARYHRDPAERQRWEWVLERTKHVALSCAGPTGFLPDFLQWDGAKWCSTKKKLLESDRDGALNWNACRTPWRLAHYLAVTGDTTILPMLQHAHHTVRSEKAFKFPNIPAGVQIHGHVKALEDYSDKAFIAPVGYLCYVLRDAEGQMQCVRALEDEAEGYFGDTIDLLIAEQASHAHEWFSGP
ncbi:Glycoside hydrolase, family 8 [Kalmanozyma brasiliensis GHG001]|uniref:Endoglucanase n=1 Tax=Kalmanozyma brasiliensis (strain GHG001) TaxID=1365824 RepID=V5EHW7_KALBG|nr:Glycoside hydrolase, family 8 [Kalmanozyma brasiliensis GHG001]EST10196.1 Glycoside hydrolase, family 8 [Kalmanozyma brasiliensis GHG001]